jgi:hypothetical protein
VVNFTPPGMKPSTHGAGGWRGPSICVDTLERRKYFVPAEILVPIYPALNLVAIIRHV